MLIRALPTIVLLSLPQLCYASTPNIVTSLTSAINSIVFFKINLGFADAPLVVLLLILTSLVLTLYLGFINVRGFVHALQLTKGDFPEPNSSGQINHFQALSTAISGTVGIGNIGGVAIAISMGGIGATFWLFIAGFLGMSTKFVECTLGVKYRKTHKNGGVSGGPMYYLHHGLKTMGLDRLGQFLGIFYAAGIGIGALGAGNMFQSHQAFTQLNHVTGGSITQYDWLFGLVLALIVFAVIIGGIKSIARVTQVLVPFMAFLYLFFGLVVIAMNHAYIGETLLTILSEAFQGKSAAGGFTGVMIIGFQRGIFSNEAGVGTASIAHSAVQTNTPITEGYVSLLEPFIDTMVICAITALVIGTTAIAQPSFADGLSGISITSAAFATRLSALPFIISFATILFAVSTQIAWSYYGLKGWMYLFGSSAYTKTIYKLLFCLCIMIGATLNLEEVIHFSDSIIFLITIPNLIGLILLAPSIKKDLLNYNKTRS